MRPVLPALAWLPPQVTFAGVIRPQGSFNVDQYRVLDDILSGLNSNNRSSLPIKQVAATLGFDDDAYFGRFFKKQTGLRPTEFRERALAALAERSSG